MPSHPTGTRDRLVCIFEFGAENDERNDQIRCFLQRWDEPS
jgi:hypothetical protein